MDRAVRRHADVQLVADADGLDLPRLLAQADAGDIVLRHQKDFTGDPARKVLLRVVVDIEQNPPAVITAYATTQFKRYGAKS